METILTRAREQGASDIHLIGGLPPAFRINGEIIIANGDALTAQQTRELTLQLLTEEQQRIFEAERELCISIFDTPAGRIRLTAYLQAGNPEAAIRLCNQQIHTAEELGLPPVIDELTRKTSGLVLITGPTGVGKTTTLNYMVNMINLERRCKIVTIEDPVEYVHAPRKAIIVQQEVHTDTASFAQALRHVLRQDPDIIVIGEMRDLETIQTALLAAETGHLVIATLHTPSATQTIDRIVSVFPSNQQNQILVQLSDTLQAVIAQKLLPRADRSGRVLATEVLIPTSGIRNIIREGKLQQLQTGMQTAGRDGDGTCTIDMSLESLYQQGHITWDMALSHCRDPNYFRARLKSNG